MLTCSKEETVLDRRSGSERRKAPSRTGGGSPPRLLFVGEACCLAHVGRPACLAAWARAAGYEVHFASGPELAWVARGEGLDPIPLFTVPKEVHLRRIKQGRFFYEAGELARYVQADRELLERILPDLVIQDFRLSMPTAAAQAGVPLLTLVNAHWSQASAVRLPAPRGGFFGRLPPPLREACFAPLRPWALRFFPEPLHAMRRQQGLPPLFDMRRYYSSGNFCAYLDLPELNPLPQVPRGHFYLGPVVWSPSDAPAPRLPGRRPLAYVTMGSTGDTRLLPEILRAALAAGLDILASGLDDQQAFALEEQISGLGERWAHGRGFDPSPVLSRAALTICHGGSGTVYQSLQHGVPVLCLPDNPDQGMVTTNLSQAGAGVVLAPEYATPSRLAGAIGAAAGCEAGARRLGAVLKMWDTRARWLAWLGVFADLKGTATYKTGPGSMVKDEAPQRVMEIGR